MYSNEYKNLTTPMGFQDGFNQVWGANDEYALIQKKLFPDDIQEILAKIDQVNPDKFSLQEVLVLHGLFWDAWYTQHQLVLDASKESVKSHLEIINSWESKIKSCSDELNTLFSHNNCLEEWEKINKKLTHFSEIISTSKNDLVINYKTVSSWLKRSLINIAQKVPLAGMLEVLIAIVIIYVLMAYSR